VAITRARTILRHPGNWLDAWRRVTLRRANSVHVSCRCRFSRRQAAEHPSVNSQFAIGGARSVARCASTREARAATSRCAAWALDKNPNKKAKKIPRLLPRDALTSTAHQAYHPPTATDDPMIPRLTCVRAKRSLTILSTSAYTFGSCNGTMRSTVYLTTLRAS